jgi:hypothetical protein
MNEAIERARGAAERLDAAQRVGDRRAEEGVYYAARHALAEMTLHCRSGEIGVAEIVVKLADGVRAYRRTYAAEPLEYAIRGYRALLAIHKEQEASELRGRAFNKLGGALLHLPTGSRLKNIRAACTAFRRAAAAWTQDAHPEEWAMAQYNLGAALVLLNMEDELPDMRPAVTATRAALTIWTRESHPGPWGLARFNLSRALAAFQGFPRDIAEKNLGQGIEALRGLLTVYAPETAFVEWATTRILLGSMLVESPPSDRVAGEREAVEAIDAVLRACPKEEYPMTWATAQHARGHVLAGLSGGDEKENMNRAVEAYHAALTVRTRVACPWDWAETQLELGVALPRLSERNRRDAAATLRDALTVFTPQAFPRRNDLAKEDLDRILHDLA